MLPIPKKLLEQGVRDMVRISDARMSGTSYGACVLHVAPESFVGGPLAFVRDGDLIELDVPARRLSLRVSDEELARRRAAWKPRESPTTRGWTALLHAARDARPTRAATSISWKAPSRRPSPRSTDGRRSGFPSTPSSARWPEGARRSGSGPASAPVWLAGGPRRRRLRLAADRHRALAHRGADASVDQLRTARRPSGHHLDRAAGLERPRASSSGSSTSACRRCSSRTSRARRRRGARWRPPATRRRACAASPPPSAPTAMAADHGLPRPGQSRDLRARAA